MRKRLREQKRELETRLLNLGALVYELHRQGKRAPELLQRIQRLTVHYLAVGPNFSFYRHIQHVIVTMPVRVVALAVEARVFFRA